MPSRPNDWWTVVRDAVRGIPHDYTSGALGRGIVLLAIPMILEMAMESIFAVVDVFFVSRLGPDAVATVGLTESMLTIMYAAAAGLSVGAMATVSRRIGEGHLEGASKAAVQAIWLGLIISIPVGIVAGWLAPSLLAVMGAGPGVLA